MNIICICYLCDIYVLEWISMCLNICNKRIEAYNFPSRVNFESNLAFPNKQKPKLRKLIFSSSTFPFIESDMMFFFVFAFSTDVYSLCLPCPFCFGGLCPQTIIVFFMG